MGKRPPVFLEKGERMPSSVRRTLALFQRRVDQEIALCKNQSIIIIQNPRTD